jgi:hypothetical protein
MEEDMSKPWPRDYNMPKVDPDKEDETQTYSYKELKKAFEEGFNSIAEKEQLDMFEAINRGLTKCNHEWKHYIGLSEQFDYCVHCDEKRK